MVEECHEPEDAVSTTLVAEGKEEPKTLLCDQCLTLDLRVDKFIIEAGPSLLDISKYTQYYQPRKSKGQFRVKSGRDWEHFSTLQKLSERRQTCPLCDLIYRAISRYGKNIDDATSCSLSWEVHGREPEGSGKGFVNKTRRLKLIWGEISGHQREVYLMLVAPHDPLQPISDASAKYRKGNHFLGRGFEDRKEKQALMKSWIDLCVKDHELCRDNHGTDEEFKDLIKQSYFGVVDVVDMQLKSLPLKSDGSPEPYVALSYVWGQKVQDEPTYTTTRRTVMTHILHGGLETAWERLPQTIQDAILIVSRLGYRYLWIDSLCIVQDSKSSWQLNASAMHLVYGNAQFTICAADGEDSSVGLRAVKPILRTMRPVANAQETMASVSGPEDINEDHSQPMYAECGPGIRLMVSRPLEAVIGDSVWNKRAWTFQERILSRRCLIFAEGRVYWQCRAISISQDIHTDGRSKGLSLDPITSPLRTLQELQSRPLWSYMSYVRMYSGRHLTKQGDSLTAFRGVSWLLERYMSTTFVFGLPASHFDLALLWSLSEVSSRKRPDRSLQPGQQTCTIDNLGNCTCQAAQDHVSGEESPTWAWAGWMGARTEYQTRMLEGCSENVREWLVSHTWIQWHVRDEKGHLQPLWDFVFRGSKQLPYQPPHTMQDGLWEGYPALSSFRSQWRHPRIRDGPSRSSSLTSEHTRASRASNLSQNHHLFGHSYDSDSSESSPHRNGINLRHWWGKLGFLKTPFNAIIAKILQNGSDASSGNSVTSHSASEEASRGRHNPERDPNAREYAYTTNESYANHRTVVQVKASRFSSKYPVWNRRDRTHRGDRAHRSAPRAPMHAAAVSHNQPGTDKYGRLIPDSIPHDDTELAAIIPDSPFGVIRRTVGRKKRSSNPPRFMPILQFCTWRSELYVMARDPGKASATKGLGTGLRWCDIVDTEGDWCGSIVLEEESVAKRQGYLCTFIALSEAKRFTLDECPVWTYYIPKEREESEWDLYYVLLLERNEEHGLWERAGLGKVFQAAFRGNVWAEIKLG
ncbi:hypothetical protein AbraIFM66951_002815 [Aspergillus brasiliensis]|uniref:Heterokaryon incompatibility domain-containing protein n=1 Tax=Aspergillus brasiliensis TaxID=319629 RepID=A0A9W6DT66_9EURO|nr:hypothetical protein AbraCBS73388_002830 [Aspergillus brasiliensis]GKZ49970.1 hypothetical protein AbraIFM66951_002815 [Aspergillus brasiliensis]